MSCRILHLSGYSLCCLLIPADVQIQTPKVDDQKSIQQNQVRKQACPDNESFNFVSAFNVDITVVCLFVCLSVGGLMNDESHVVSRIFFLENWELQL